MSLSSAGKRFFTLTGKAFLLVFIFLNIVLAMHAWKFTHFYNDPSLRRPSEQGLLATTSFILAGNRLPKRLNDSVPNLPFSVVPLTTVDGLALQGWSISCFGIFEDSLATLRSNLNYHKGTVILFHGHGTCRSALLPEAKAFLKMGYNVFMIDFRAHGNSSGEQCMVGMKESADVKAAYDYVVKTGEKNIILFGVSMGAATITRAINDYHISPSKVILEMPFGSMLEATRGKLAIMGLPGTLAPLLTFWGGTLNGEWAFSYQPAVYAQQFTCPVLLQWGRNDPRVTISETNAVFNNIKSSKKLVVYEHSGHESLLEKEPAKWLENVQLFLN
jgi:uncharacterized protein